MKLLFFSVGKSHERYVKEGIDDFTARINHYFPAEWLLISNIKNSASLSVSELKREEAKAILAALQTDDVLILLDERGKMISSIQLSQLIQQKANESCKRIVFLIGGAFGVDDVVFKRANATLSLSGLTFPHMLVRLILAEQIYRACTILKNEKYHHSWSFFLKN